MSRPKRDTKRITFLCPVTHLDVVLERMETGQAQGMTDSLLQIIWESKREGGVNNAVEKA